MICMYEMICHPWRLRA